MSLKNKQNYCFIVLKAHRSGHVVVQNTESLPIQETGPITTTEYIVFTVFCIVLQFYFSQSEIERKRIILLPTGSTFGFGSKNCSGRV